MPLATITLITGGTHSGKSRFALEKMSGYSRKIFLATAVVTDDEMKERIKKHREMRSPDFLTLEEPLHLAKVIRDHAPSADAILVDCLTFWLNNLFHHFGSSPCSRRIPEEMADFLAVLEERPTPLVLVTNEINMGVTPGDSLTRQFVDQHSWLSQEVAKRSDEVILMIAGMPQILKQSSPSFSPHALRGTGEGRGMRQAPESVLPNEISVWENRIRSIPPLDPLWREKARHRLRDQTRPEGSLGELEGYLERLVAIQKKERPSVSKKRILIFSGDHGVEREGVSLYPREVTSSMVYNFLSGGATINAFARSVGVEVEVMDVGVDHEFGKEPNLIQKKIRRGTANIRTGPAMSPSEMGQALELGWETAHQAKEDGVELLGAGEMGIANTTAASAVIAALTKTQPEQVTGRGTGIDGSMLEHKIQVIKDALRTNQSYLKDPLSILQCLGGFEIASIAGMVIGAATCQIPCIVDGWIASAGALVPIQVNPAIADYLFFAHESEEKGHRLLLEELDVKPILKLSMRLGEGTGACLAMGILNAAIQAYNDVATFEEAKVSGRKK